MSDPQKSKEELHAYWSSPEDAGNQPSDYANEEIRPRSILLRELVDKHHGRKEEAVLEIGCNAGRNLNELHETGYSELHGIELSPSALTHLKEAYPSLGQSGHFYEGQVETYIRDFKDGQFGVIFTMAVLAHIHRENEWVFEEMARICSGTLVTVEDERVDSWKHFRRRYDEVFVPLGFEQVETFACEQEKHLLDDAFIVRVFRKVST